MQLYSQPPMRSSSPSVIPQDVPVYRIRSREGFYCDDVLYPEGSIVAYGDEPNMDMEPLNGMASENMTVFLAKLDQFGRQAAEKAGKAYVSYTDAFNNMYALAKEEGKRVTLLNGREDTPILGTQTKKRGRPKAAKLDMPSDDAQPVHMARKGSTTE